MNKIINILMQRDGMNENDAIALFKEGQTAILNAMDSYSEVEDLMADYFGLEMDYIWEII